MKQAQWRQVWWHFTPEQWWALDRVVASDHVTADDLAAAKVLVEGGFLKNVSPHPGGIHYHVVVTGAGLQAWEWKHRQRRRWRTRTVS
jgi:hypothetical protein